VSFIEDFFVVQFHQLSPPVAAMNDVERALAGLFAPTSALTLCGP